MLLEGSDGSCCKSGRDGFGRIGEFVAESQRFSWKSGKDAD
jgi:hypothetical protein